MRQGAEWEGIPRTGTELDLDDGEENEIQEKEYGEKDISDSMK